MLVHGYAAGASAFDAWRALLVQSGRDVATIHVGDYVSLSNEITVKDIAEGLDRALRGLGLGDDGEFDAIVHSTGMLVIRSWLCTYPRRRERLKHLVALAPATFGSPLAHKGRSWLGRLFRGNRQFGPDFMEAGDQVLDALELGSRFTWELAHRDLVGDETFYGRDGTTPYVFVFCGTRGYRGIAGVVNEPGTDGTVRWAGASLDSRKVVVDLTRAPRAGEPRATLARWCNVSDLPVVLVNGCDHGSILSDPPAPLRSLVLEALTVDDEHAFTGWRERARAFSATAEVPRRYQQFVVRVVDERNDPVSDYNITLHLTGADGRRRELTRFHADVHAYARDRSLRNFILDVGPLLDGSVQRLELRLLASSGSRLVGYRGFDLTDDDVPGEAAVAPSQPVEEVRVDLTAAAPPRGDRPGRPTGALHFLLPAHDHPRRDPPEPRAVAGGGRERGVPVPVMSGE